MTNQFFSGFPSAIFDDWRAVPDTTQRCLSWIWHFTGQGSSYDFRPWDPQEWLVVCTNSPVFWIFLDIEWLDPCQLYCGIFGGVSTCTGASEPWNHTSNTSSEGTAASIVRTYPYMEGSFLFDHHTSESTTRMSLPTSLCDSVWHCWVYKLQPIPGPPVAHGSWRKSRTCRRAASIASTMASWPSESHGLNGEDDQMEHENAWDDDYIWWWLYMMIIYDDYIWWLYMEHDD